MRAPDSRPGSRWRRRSAVSRTPPRGTQALHDRLAQWRTVAGGIAGPFEAWLALRGLRTLPLRIARQSETALRVAGWLARHPRVTAVYYPGLAGRARAVAERQMRGGFGPLLSFELDGDGPAADAVVAASRIIRLSVGIESPDDLLADLEQALAAKA